MADPPLEPVRAGHDVPAWRHLLSPGLAVIVGLALVSSAWVALRPPPESNGRPFWVFADSHADNYRPIIGQWNQAHPDRAVEIRLVQFHALERLLLSASFGGTPVGDLLEVERGIAARLFRGPVDRIPLLDLTDRLRRDGVDRLINEPSFSIWTTRGRVFGLPHDVHPVVLAYRADLLGEAGLDPTGVETWEELLELLRPLQQDLTGDGRGDRYALNFWPTIPALGETLLRQADCPLFDADGRPALDTPRTAELVARMVSWCVGSARSCTEAPELTASGHRLRLEGVVLCAILPDWMVGTWKREIPGLAGKVRLMPLPAWEKGGRRTSVYGGTMLAISRTAPDPEAAWTFAKHLYLAPELAESLWREVNILTPVKPHWERPVFHEPDPYFGGQRVGELFIALAPEVPRRLPTPFSQSGQDQLGNVLLALQSHAESTGRFTWPELLPEAARLLARAQENLLREVGRSPFHQR